MKKLSNDELKNVSGGCPEEQPRYNGHVCVHSGWAPICKERKRNPRDVEICLLCANFRRIEYDNPVEGRDGYCIVL